MVTFIVKIRATFQPISNPLLSMTVFVMRHAVMVQTKKAVNVLTVVKRLEKLIERTKK